MLTLYFMTAIIKIRFIILIALPERLNIVVFRITLIVTVAFSISSMFYNISTDYAVRPRTLSRNDRRIVIRILIEGRRCA